MEAGAGGQDMLALESGIGATAHPFVHFIPESRRGANEAVLTSHSVLS